MPLEHVQPATLRGPAPVDVLSGTGPTRAQERDVRAARRHHGPPAAGTFDGCWWRRPGATATDRSSGALRLRRRDQSLKMIALADHALRRLTLGQRRMLYQGKHPASLTLPSPARWSASCGTCSRRSGPQRHSRGRTERSFRRRLGRENHERCACAGERVLRAGRGGQGPRPANAHPRAIMRPLIAGY
jgi:hypothetical protein